MQFSTKVPIANSQSPISYTSKIVSLGSCFAENIGDKFDYFKFQNTVNPFGIIFNPVSIEKVIRKAIAEEQFTENDIFFHNDLYHCFDVHSELSSPDKEIFLKNLNQIAETTRKQLTEVTHITITLGTAWVYRNCKSNAIVANCHKVPQKEFTKELLSVETIQQSLESSISLITAVNPKVKFIFTVSPVRHIKDGFTENQLSKSHLITALHKTLQLSDFRLSAFDYFPSYEIMMDELRDYRFYAEDMLHPNAVAIDYIWERFSETNISEAAHSTMKEIDAIQKALQHRPFNPDSESHQKFLKNLEMKMGAIKKQLPHINFQK